MTGQATGSTSSSRPAHWTTARGVTGTLGSELPCVGSMALERTLVPVALCCPGPADPGLPGGTSRPLQAALPWDGAPVRCGWRSRGAEAREPRWGSSSSPCHRAARPYADRSFSRYLSRKESGSHSPAWAKDPEGGVTPSRVGPRNPLLATGGTLRWRWLGGGGLHPESVRNFLRSPESFVLHTCVRFLPWAHLISAAGNCEAPCRRSKFRVESPRLPQLDPCRAVPNAQAPASRCLAERPATHS